MTTNFIEITGLHKDFHMGNVVVRALDGVDLAMEPNSFTVVMGPSGSGKSTLLHLVGGLDRPTSGSIRVGQQLIEKLDENALAEYRRRTVGFVFQSFNLIQSMSALDNIAFPMRFAHISLRKRRAIAMEMLQRVGLQDRGVHRPTELSGGQQQRVAIARSLVNNPKLILADEPTGNLDTASGASIMQLLSDLHKGGRSVLVVTHDQRMRKFATQVVFLIDGHLVEEEEYNEAVTMALREPSAVS